MKRLNDFQQKASSHMFERFWICLWYRSLKYCNFKTSNHPPSPSPEKWKKEKQKRFYISYIFNKITLTTENSSTVLHNLFLLDMSMFNDLVIKNDPVKKQNPSLLLWRGFNCITTKSWYKKTERFTAKFSVDRKFNILANFNLVLSTS